MRSGEGSASSSQTTITVDRRWGSSSMCQMIASELPIIDRYCTDATCTYRQHEALG